MISQGVHVGFECKPCNFKIGMYIGGTTPACPNCSKEMTAIEGEDAPEVVTNFVCQRCGTSIGVMPSLTPVKACPHCGAEIS